MDLLVATGFRKPVCNLKITDRLAILSALVEYHLMAKMKAEMDQFKEGLNALGFLDIVRRNTSLWEPFFMHHESKITAGRTVMNNMLSVCISRLSA